MRPGDFDLLQFLRTWVFLNKHNGVLASIYKKYTEVALVDSARDVSRSPARRAPSPGGGETGGVRALDLR